MWVPATAMGKTVEKTAAAMLQADEEAAAALKAEERAAAVTAAMVAASRLAGTAPAGLRCTRGHMLIDRF